MKKFKLVLATSAVLLGSISVLATSNFTKGNEGFTLTSVIEGNKEVVGVKRAMVEEGDKAVFTDGEGTSTLVSPAMAQVVTKEDGTTNLRFVAAVKADLTGSAVNAVKAVMPGDVGFHVSYGEKDVTYDVEHAYSSMVASGNFYYANEYSSWYGENGTNNENNKPMTDWLALGGFEDNGYNLSLNKKRFLAGCVEPDLHKRGNKIKHTYSVSKDKMLEYKETIVNMVEGAEVARKVIAECIENYKKEFLGQ